MSWALLQNSLLVGLAATLLATIFGFSAALFGTGLGRGGRTALMVMAVVALVLPPFLVVNCWLSLTSHSGILSRWSPLLLSFWGASWLLGLLLWPIAFLLISSAWRQLDTVHLESDMAVTGWPLIRGLLIPLASGSIVQSALILFVLALNNFTIPAILQVKVFTAEIWIRFSTLFDTRGALLLSWPLAVAPLLALLLLRRKQLAWPGVESPVEPKLFRRQLGHAWFGSAAVLTVCVCALSVALPTAQLAFEQRTWTELAPALSAGRAAIWTSLWLSLSAGALVIGLGLVCSGSLLINRRQDNPVEGVAGILAWMPFFVPGVLTGILLIHLFNRPVFNPIYQGMGIVLIALMIRYAALGWHGMRKLVRSTDSDLTDAALLDGATRWRLLCQVHWPQVSPKLFAAWYIVFLLCLWDVESMILVTPPGGETLALRIFNLLHYGHNAQVNALCLALLGVALLPLVITVCFWPVRHFWRRPGVMFMVVFLTVAMLASGCHPSNPPGEARINSKLFLQASIIGSRGAGLGELNKPRSVTVDHQDNVFAVDMTGRVQKFSPDGGFLLSWQMPETDLGKAKGMCRGRNQDILVIEPHYQRINHFSPSGEVLKQWGRKGKGPGEFTLPRGVGVNSHGEIFVSEYGASERVQRFDSDGNFISSFGQPGTRDGEFNRPEGLFVDSQDLVYVADSCNHRIQVFSREGTLVRSYGKPGSGPGQLSYPYDICVDAEGLQYVCEFGNSRIQVFDRRDEPVETIGKPGIAPGEFNNPWGVALDSFGNLYVADSLNHRLQKLSRRASTGARPAPF